MTVNPSEYPLHTILAGYYDLFFSAKYPKEVKVIDWIIKKYAKRRTIDVLDLMCGTGAHMLLLSKKGYNVTGIDLSGDIIEVARKKLVNSKNRYALLNADVREINFKEKFDLIYCWFNSIQYFFKDEELKNVLSNVYHALRDQGLFIVDMRNGTNFIYRIKKKIPISTKISQNKVEIVNLVRDVNLDETTDVATIISEYNVDIDGKKLKLKENHQYRLFEKDNFSNFLKEAGFKIVDILGSSTEIGVSFSKQCDKMVFIALKE